MANFATAIEPVANLGGAVSFPCDYIIEESGQTFLYGTPVNINGTDGGVQAWSGITTFTNVIAGIALFQGSNLGTTGSGAPQGFTPVLGVGSVIGNYAANPNQPLAVITPSLVPFNDGRILVALPAQSTLFVAKYGNAGNAAATTNQLVGGAPLGLTKDSNNLWYVDAAKTGGSSILQIVKLDPRDAVGTVGGRVWFYFLPAAAQLQP